jgi:hypothetical protein
MRLLKIIVSERQIAEGMKIPWGYGIAWAAFERRVFICYPFPLNWIFAALRKLWFKVRDVNV